MRLGRKLAEGFAVDPAVDLEAEQSPLAPDAPPETVDVSGASDAPRTATPAERPLPV